MPQAPGFTRRGLLLLVSGAGAQSWFRLYAGSSDFWNKKEPAEWSSDEIDKLVTKSPWAKELTVSSTSLSRGYNNGGGAGDPGVGGGGYPSGGDIGRRRRLSGRRQAGRGWAAVARRRARRRSDPDFVQSHRSLGKRQVRSDEVLKRRRWMLANQYVISVSGVPVVQGGRQHSDDEGDTGTTVSKGLSDEVLDRIKNLTYLEPKGKSPAQPSAVVKGAITSSGVPTLLFGFPRDVVPLTADDREVTFTTQLRASFEAEPNLA